jgi:NAD(P)-dependent dehydrogenase (short-subunit alcohol dehydrogenase family)
MDMGLKGQTVLVTGSSSGIGRATAIAFGAEGASKIHRIIR